MSVAEPHDVCIEVPHGHHLLSVLLHNASAAQHYLTQSQSLHSAANKPSVKPGTNTSQHC